MAVRRGPEGPWAGALLREVIARVKRGWPPGLVLFAGDEAWHLDRAKRSILDALVPDDASFGLTVFDDEKVSTATVAAAARSGGGMFASRRVVVVRDLALLEGEAEKDKIEPLAAYAADPSPDSHVLVLARALDRKRRLHASLAEAGTLLVFRSPASEPEVAEATAAVEGMAREAGIALGSGAAAFLLERVEGDFLRVAREIDKAAAWAEGATAPLTKGDLAAIVHGDAASTGWELSDAITARDGAAAARWARRLGGVRDRGEAIPIVGGIAWRARTLLKAKAMLARGAREQEVVDACRAWAYRGGLLAGLKRYTLEELLAFPARLLEADRALKGGALPARAVLESLAADLIAGSTSSGARR